MLKIYKYLLFSIILTSISYAQSLTWGGYTKLDISKKEANQIIKEYVDREYPEIVKEYEKELDVIKNEKIKNVSDTTFVYKNLMWQDTNINTTSKRKYLEAKKYCKYLVLAKRKDWRLPTYKELLEIVDYSKADPAIQNGFKYVNSLPYWSSTEKKEGKKSLKKSYWYVDFSIGSSDFTNELELNHFRCVRELSDKKDDY